MTDTVPRLTNAETPERLEKRLIEAAIPGVKRKIVRDLINLSVSPIIDGLAEDAARQKLTDKIKELQAEEIRFIGTVADVVAAGRADEATLLQDQHPSWCFNQLAALMERDLKPEEKASIEAIINELLLKQER